MLCAHCLTENPSGNRFCDSCGTSMECVCPSCGNRNRGSARFCAGCGRNLVVKPAPRAPVPLAPVPLAPVPLMPSRLATQVLDSRFAREGERKLVTVLFADIRGSTEMIHDLDPEQALLRLDPTLQAMSEAVHRFGGTVNRMHGDGIMALFGAPLAHEDHAVRACLAARTMLDLVAGAGDHTPGVRVGLHSGEVVVRSIGNDMSMEYEAVGMTAHLASRVEQAATPGTACLTAETVRLAGGLIVTRPLGPTPLKGLAAPVELFELIGMVGRNRWEARAASHGLTRFVGRATELDLLLQGVRRARAGHGTVIELVGEAGMGKSRLVHELVSHPDSDSCVFVSAAAMPYDRDTPYFFVSGLVRNLLGVNLQDGVADIERKLVSAVDWLRDKDKEDGVLTALRALLDLPFADAAWDTIDATQRRQRTHEAVRSMLMRAAGTSTIALLLEDLHWADAESLSVLKVIVGSISASQLLVLATSRPEFDSGWPRYSYSSLVRLGPLQAAEATTLLCDLLGDGPELSDLRQRLVARTGGEPLFLEELARALVETGALQRGSDGFHLTRGYEEIEIPNSLQAIIASRIDRLPVDSRTLLQIASVIGKDIAIGPLRAVADLPEAQLLVQLASLQSLEFLHEVTKPNLEYTFKHALTHSVTYEGMLLKHRRALHARVMAVIELLYADRLEEFTERLAQHAVRAENYAKAVEYNYKAGLRANARSAYLEAAVFLERASEALARLPDTTANADRGIDICLGLRVALLASGDLMQVRVYLDRAEALARALDDRRRLMHIIISRSTILVNLGALGQAIETGLQGRSLAEQVNDTSCYVSASFALGQAYWNRGEFKSALSVLSNAVDRASFEQHKAFKGTTGSLSVLCRVSLSHTHSLMGEMDWACGSARDALELARETARPYDLSYAHAAQGLAYLVLGNVTDAVRHLEEALHFSEAGDIKLLFPHAARYLGRAYALVGRLDEARLLLERAVNFAAPRSLVALHGWCAASLSLTQLLMGELPAARSSASVALELAERHGYAPLHAHAARLMGAIAGRQKTAHAGEEAESWYRRGLKLAGEIGMQPEVGHCHRELAQVLARIGRKAEARSALATAARVFHASSMPIHGFETEQELAALPLDAGLMPAALPMPHLGLADS